MTQRQPGWYFVRVDKPGALEEEPAFWTGSHWRTFSFSDPVSDTEVTVLSKRIVAPSEGDGSPQGGIAP